MPFPNEHSCRISDPGKYIRFRREKNFQGTGYDIIFGFKEDGGSEIQAYRYPKATFTADRARTHCNSKGGSFEVATGDELLGIDHDEFIVNSIDDSHSDFVTFRGVFTKNGVMNKGFKPAEEIEKTWMFFEMRPVTRGHPKDGLVKDYKDILGFTSGIELKHADSPGDINDFKIPEIHGDINIWRIHKKEIDEIRKLGKLPISAGFWFRREDAKGTFAGMKYSFTQHDLLWDHLALLYDGDGACNFKQGCGLFIDSNIVTNDEGDDMGDDICPFKEGEKGEERFIDSMIEKFKAVFKGKDNDVNDEVINDKNGGKVPSNDNKGEEMADDVKDLNDKISALTKENEEALSKSKDELEEATKEFEGLKVEHTDLKETHDTLSQELRVFKDAEDKAAEEARNELVEEISKLTEKDAEEYKEWNEDQIKAVLESMKSTDFSMKRGRGRPKDEPGMTIGNWDPEKKEWVGGAEDK